MRKNILFVIVMLSQSFTDMICVNNDNPTPQSDCLRGRCRPLCPACVKEKLTPQLEREKEPEMKETLADLINRVESDERERRDDDKIGKEQTAFQLVMNKSLKNSGQGALLGALFFLFGRMLPTTVKLLKKGSKKGKICLSRIMSIAFLQKDVNSFYKLSQKEVDELSMKLMGICICGAAVGIFIKGFFYPISSKIYRNKLDDKPFFSGINRYDFNLDPKTINEIFGETT
jgi:hypothetical protein